MSDFLKTLELFYKEVDAALAERGQRLLLIVEDLEKIPDVEKARLAAGVPAKTTCRSSSCGCRRGDGRLIVRR